MKKTPNEAQVIENAIAERPAPEADRRSAEDWALEHGLLPRLAETTGRGLINPLYWRFAATKAFKRWTDGQQMTLVEFEQAVAEAMRLQHG